MAVYNHSDDVSLAYLLKKTEEKAATALAKAVKAINSAIDTINGTLTSIQTALNGKVSKTGDTMTGGLTIERVLGQTALVVKLTDEDVTETPSANSNNGRINFNDKNDVTFGTIRARRETNGQRGLVFYAQNSGSSNNYIMLEIDENGNRKVEVNAQQAWRNALELGTNGAFPLTIAQGGTGGTTPKAAMAALGGTELVNCSYCNSSRSIQISVTSALRCLIVVSSAASARCAFQMVWFASATATPVLTSINKGSNITLTAAAGKLTIANSSGSNAYVDVLCLIPGTQDRVTYSVVT